MPPSRPDHLVNENEEENDDENDQQESGEQRLAAVRRHSAMMSGAYGPDYLDRLREEWPEWCPERRDQVAGAARRRDGWPSAHGQDDMMQK